jgi:hypothetical protein
MNDKKDPLLKQKINSKGQQWKPGQSGNPKGRPRGTGKVAEMRDSIAEQIPGIINQLVESAKNGDIQASRLLLDRTIPTLKPAEETIILALPDGSITDQGQAVMIAVTAGTITVSQGIQLLTAIGAQDKLSEIDQNKQKRDALDAMFPLGL